MIASSPSSTHNPVGRGSVRCAVAGVEMPIEVWLTRSPSRTGRRPENQHGDDDEVDRQHFHFGHQRDRGRPHPADDERTDQRAAHAAEPADHDHREGFDHEFDRHVERGRARRHHQRAADGAQHAADGEHQREDLRHVDAEPLGHVAIFGGGAHDAADVGALEKQAEPDARSQGWPRSPAGCRSAPGHPGHAPCRRRDRRCPWCAASRPRGKRNASWNISRKPKVISS